MQIWNADLVLSSTIEVEAGADAEDESEPVECLGPELIIRSHKTLEGHTFCVSGNVFDSCTQALHLAMPCDHELIIMCTMIIAPPPDMCVHDCALLTVSRCYL